MGDTDNTEGRGYFDAGGWINRPEPPRVKVDNRGMLNIYPFGIVSVDINLGMTIDRWREIAALAEKAIAEHEAAHTEAAAS